jgi:hypothetical protein
MKPDPIVEEVHQIRAAISERFGNDLRAICDDARQRQQAGPGRTTSRPPRLAQPLPDAAKQAVG